MQTYRGNPYYARPENARNAKMPEGFYRKWQNRMKEIKNI
jgi:hypothetical protein